MGGDIISKLENLVIGSKAFKDLENELKYFCPFEAMGMAEQEIRHAHFLSYIIDPNRPHEFEDAFLRAFLNIATQKALGEGIPVRPIDIHLMDLHEARIDREQDRIDLQIEIPSTRAKHNKRTILVIELKINAKESPDQLRRYEGKIRRRYEDSDILFFYLTKSGDDPSEGNRDAWTPLALSDVIDEFDKVAQRSVGHEHARRAVQAYIAMMRRKHVGDKNERLQELARELWSEHKEALEFLSAAQPDDVSDILNELDKEKQAFCELLKDRTAWEFRPDADSSPRSIILYPQEFDPLNGGESGRRIFVLVIDRNYGDRDKLRFRWLLRPGPAEVRSEIYDKISGPKRVLKPGWTQIAVDKLELNASIGLSDIQEKVVNFVVNNQANFSEIVQLKHRGSEVSLVQE